MSRSRGFLWKFAVGAILIGTGIGWALSQRAEPEAHFFGERVLALAGVTTLQEPDKAEAPDKTQPGLLEAFAAEVARPDVEMIDVLWTIPHLSAYVAAQDYGALREPLAKRFGEAPSALAIDYLAAWARTDLSAFDRLAASEQESPPLRYRFYVLGKLALKQQAYEAAFAHFRREGEHPDAYESRYLAIRALEMGKDFQTLESLRADQHYARYFTPGVELSIAAAQRRWGDIIRLVPEVQISAYRSELWIIAAVTGFAWGLFLLPLGELRTWRSSLLPLCSIGVLAGVLSTTLTIFFIVVQDDVWSFSEGEEVEQIFAYYIGGVGLREELAKLLLFAPLILFLRKRDEELDALLVACCVGLGFAIEENVGYFGASAAASAPGRFLTANFLHIALTGLNGLALFRCCTRGMSGVNDFLLVFPLTVVAHGVYDALLSARQIDGGNYFAMMCFVAICYYFFARVHPLRGREKMTLSLTGAFVIGLSILAATVIAFQMATLGATAGASLIFNELLGSAVILFVFFREFNEPLTA